VATLVVDDGYDLDTALKRAGRRLGINPQQLRPPLEVLRLAIQERRSLFRPQQMGLLDERRRLALGAMRTFAGFRPRLFGALIHGDGPLDVVRLLVTAEPVEQLLLFLQDRGMPWREGETLLHYSGGRRLAQPTLRFQAGDTTVELVVLPPASHSDPPRDPVTGGPLETLGADELETLIARAAP
jgi:hypothetical protein